MVVTLKKWGNSTAVRIPSKVIEKLNWKVGQDLDFSISEEGLTLKTSPKKNIRDLFIGFDGKIDGDEIDWGNPQGKEIW